MKAARKELQKAQGQLKHCQEVIEAKDRRLAKAGGASPRVRFREYGDRRGDDRRDDHRDDHRGDYQDTRGKGGGQKRGR